MKSGIAVNNLRIVLFVFLGLIVAPYNSHAGGVPEQVQERIRETLERVQETLEGAKQTIEDLPLPGIGQGRAITIINETGYPLSRYSVNAAASGVEIQKGASPNDSLTIRINSRYNINTVIEVVLVDRYERTYAKTFDIPLEGNTETPVTRKDRKSEGFFKDRWKDIIAWFNEHK